jgi:hypothetical protein
VTWPGDRVAAAGRGHLRTSHAEREHAVGLLKTAFVQGRLTKDELESRAGRAFTSQTYAELATVTADLPVELLPVRPKRGPSQAQPPVNSSLRTGATIVASVAMLTAFLWAAAFLTENNGVIEVSFLITLADFAIIPMFAFVAAAQAIDKRQQNPPRGQPPPPPYRGTEGRDSGRSAPAGPAQLPRQADDDRWPIAEATLQPPHMRHWAAGSHRIRSAIIMIATRSA